MSVPVLRFNEFSEDWKYIEIGNVGDVITGSTPDTSEHGFYSGQKMFVSPVDMNSSRFISETKTTLTDAGFKRGRKIKAESVLFVCIGSTIGKVAQNKVECITNQQINSVVPNGNHSNNFIYSRLERDAKEISLLAGKQAVPIINKTTFSKIKICVPELPEQTKIANFLTAVDEKITHLTQKHALLTQYKKGVMQQIFSQQLRFKDEDGREFPEWEERELGDLCATFKSGAGITSDEIDEDGDYPVFGGNGLRGYTNSFTHDGFFALIGRQGALCGNINRSKGKAYISEHAIAVCANENADTEWLAQRLDTLKLNRLSESSAQPGLSVNKLVKLKLLAPSKQEQTKIANFLTTLDDKLTTVQTQLNAMKQYKKGLLQQMFV